MQCRKRQRVEISAGRFFILCETGEEENFAPTSPSYSPPVYAPTSPSYSPPEFQNEDMWEYVPVSPPYYSLPNEEDGELPPQPMYSSSFEDREEGELSATPITPVYDDDIICIDD